jgi:acyl-CoA thioesterase
MATQDLPREKAIRVKERVAEFNRSEVARLLGMECVETWDFGARVVMETDGKRGPRGTAHGGIIFTLADQAFAIAANQEEIPQVALSAYIQYIAPAAGRLEAVADRVEDNGANSVYRVVVYERDRIVALFDGVGIKV